MSPKRGSIPAAAVFAMVVAIATALALTGACAKRPPKVQAAAAEPSVHARFTDQLLQIAHDYKKFQRVSDQTNWSPVLCRPQQPEGVIRSDSRDDATHGRKLYFLYVKDAGSYDQIGFHDGPYAKRPGPAPRVERWVNPTGQAVVKEAFKPVPVPATDAPAPIHSFSERKLPQDHAVFDGVLYRTGDPAGLFVMLKLDPATPGTDQGWVYATMPPDGGRVLESGRIASCMKCHQETTRDRLYGPRWSWPIDPAKHTRDPAANAVPAAGAGATGPERK